MKTVALGQRPTVLGGVPWGPPFPIAWGLSRLLDVADVGSGYPFLSEFFSLSGETRLIRIRDLTSDDDVVYTDESHPSEARVIDGDILIGMDGDYNVVRWQGGPAVLNQRVSRIRAHGEKIERRFLYYCAPSPLRVINDLTYFTTVKHLSGGDIRRIRIPLPPPLRQRAIADFLDREMARIDALIEKKQGLIALTEERWQVLLETRIRKLSHAWGDSALKYACREIVVGIVITPAAWYADSGVIALRGVNVSPGLISVEDVVYLTDEGHALHDKSRLSTGDVVIVRTGQAGAAAVVPPHLEGANCIDLVIARPGADLRPYFLEYVLNSDWMQKHIEENSVGTIQSHFNVGAAKRVPIPMAPLHEQDRAINDLRAARASAMSIIERLGRQVSLLQERRQALITAAVTGQFDVSGAA